MGHRGRRRGEIREGRAVVGEVAESRSPGNAGAVGRKIAREAMAEADAVGSRFQEFQAETNLTYGG